MFSLIRADIFLYSHGFLYICKQNTPRMKKTIILFTLILCCMTACTGSQKKKIL